MINTNTLVPLYADFCELGYPIEQLEEGESKTFNKFNKESFLKDIVIAIDQVNL